jgi:hypothetical protein
MTLTKTLLVVLSTSVAVLSCSDGADSTSPDGNGAAGVGGGDSIPFCAALGVIRAKCQRCHRDPPQNGAPVPFLTYADTQAPYYVTDKKWSDTMLPAVTQDFMPDVALNDPPTSLMPPVEPLTANEKTTLVTWLQQGAKPTGGTDCP